MRLKIRVSVVRFRPWPPFFSAGYVSTTPQARDAGDYSVTVAPRIPSSASWCPHTAEVKPHECAGMVDSRR